MPDEQWPQIKQGKAACYRIAVQGGLDENKWSGRLGGMQIESRKEGDRQAFTILNGEVQDQAELMGVLNTLYQLHLDILSVNREPCQETEANR